MNAETSLYLDAWRLTMALVVLFGHLAGQRLTGGVLWQLGPYTNEAVSVFFVLSGFVIGFVTDTRPATALSYAIARASRIYSVALPALLVTFALDAFGRSSQPGLDSAAWGYHADGQVWQFLSGLLFVNRVWGLDINQGSDLAYWSLGCEVWYYVLFGIACFAPARWRALGVAATIAFVGPTTALLFPLWLLGVYGYRICATRQLSQPFGVLLALGSIALWIVYEATARTHGRFEQLVPGWLGRIELVQDYVVGGLFMLHIVGFHAISRRFGPLAMRLSPPIRWAAGATFSIYLFHLPVAQFLAAQCHWGPTAWQTRAVVLGGTLVTVFALAELSERRKAWWSRIMTRLAIAWLPPQQGTASR